MFKITTANVIKLTLLHPFQSIPVRSWTFQQEPIIRIGRSMKNHVVLYSAVVSRHHVEIRHFTCGWKVFNLGTNGTYIEGVPVSESWVENGQIIHLAISGPKIQLSIDPHQHQSQSTNEISAAPEYPVKVLHPYELPTQITKLSPSQPNSTNPSETYEEITEVDRCD
ncbi:MAG: FHA domain-containing protein [Microcoleaceae cyanobacterium]